MQKRKILSDATSDSPYRYNYQPTTIERDTIVDPSSILSIHPMWSVVSQH